MWIIKTSFTCMSAFDVHFLFFFLQIIERKSDLARLESLDCGKPLDEAAWDMVCDPLLSLYIKLFFLTSWHYILVCTIFLCQDDVAGCFEYFAGHAEALDKRQNAAVSLPENFKCHLKKEPIGVVALITPWYFWLLFHHTLFSIYDT